MTTLTFLKDSEIELFDFPPRFTEEERSRFFVLPNDNDIKFRKTETKIGYILQEGYFKSHKKFFPPEHYHIKDVEYVKTLLGIKRDIEILKYYNKAIYSFHKQIILNKNGYNSFSGSKDLFEKEASELVKTSLRPKEIFYALLDYMDEKRIEVPRYYLFAEVITTSLNLFENNLIDIIDQALTVHQKELLDLFIRLPVDTHQPLSAKNPYLITYLKNVEQSVTPGNIKKSLEDFHQIRYLHGQLSDFFTSDLMSNELINYYAIWILKAKYVQFDSIDDTSRKRLYALSFITWQYKIRQDYFVDTFLQAVQKYYNDAERFAYQSFLQKDIKFKEQEQVTKIRKIVSETKLNEIWEIIFSHTGGDSEKVRLIKEIFNKTGTKPGDAILKELDELENTGIKDLKNRLFHEELNKGYRKLLNRVSGILLVLDFNPQNSNPEIFKAIEYYQKKNTKINNTGKVPMEFLGKNEQKWLFENDGAINYNLYKIFLFKAIFDHIKAGSLNLLFSERYKSVDDYLINSKRWKENKKELISRAGLEKLNMDPLKMIDLLKDTVENQYKTTNVNITDNPYIRFNTKGVARVTTPKSSSDIQEGIIPELVGTDNYLPLTKILSDIRYCTDYISSFVHYSMKSSKSTPSDESFYAAIIALGCNIGIRRMGKISDGMTADRLEYIVRWFCSKKNIDEANRKITSLTRSLPLSEIFPENRKKLNTSSDGQKYDVTIPSLHASHSPKYFGTGKGVSVYSFIDEKDRLYYNEVISASERESGFVLDGLFHNEDTTISDTHSTDTHGFSETVFGICYLLDVQFTPRIKNYQEQLLYTFKDKTRKLYENQAYKILPAKSSYINEGIIMEQWDQILRLLCTIKLKETLPSNILKRLSSYSKQNPLYKAIKEVGRIYKTIFLLKYYDEVLLRQNIEKQLNRVELSHLFAKTVFFGNNRELKYATKEEQEIAFGCRHLIQNAIILWNYLFVSEKLFQITNQKELQIQIDLLKNSSMMSWQHVNLHGKYDFDIEVNTTPFDLIAVKSLNINQI